MTPSFLDNMSWRMAEVYGAVTDRILINLSKYFAFVNDSAEAKGSFEYQARMLAKMGQVTKETVDIIANSLDGADAALRAALEAAIMNALRNEEPKLRQAAQLGLLGAVPPSFVPDQSQAFKAYYQQSADKLNLVNTVMIESTQAAYSATVADAAARLERTQGFLNVAAGETVTGVSTYNQAMRGAVAKMVKNGLTGFIDHAGRRWTPETYVAMDVRTTMFRTARAAIWERQDQYGNDLYQVSSHNGARPLCYPWQGKVISRSDTVRDVTDLDGNTVHVYAQSETSYGQAAGLFGVNCGHYPMSFIPGVSTLKGEPQDPEENEKTYAESQEQRALERKLRAERRDLAVMKAQGESPEAIRKQQERVKTASAEIDDFCDRTGRARRKLREYTPIDAKWPNKDSYDPQTFPHEQKDKLAEWFKNDNNNPPPTPTQIHLGPDNIPPMAQAQIPVDNAVKEQKSYFKDFNQLEELSSEQAGTLNNRFRELDSKYHAKINDIKTTLQRDQEEYDIQFSNYKKQLREDNPRMRESTIEKRALEVMGPRPSYNGPDKFNLAITGGDFNWEDLTLTINPQSIGSGVSIDTDITHRAKKAERDERRRAEGRTVFAKGNVGTSLEGSFIHEYGHAIDRTYGISEDIRFLNFYNSLTRDDVVNGLSEYAATNKLEFVAEAFYESFMGDTQGELSKRLMAILEEIVNDKY